MYAWYDGDGTAPTLGAAATNTGGTPTAAGASTPYLDDTGTRVTATRFADGAHYRNTTDTSLAVGSTKDVIVIARFRPMTASLGNIIADRVGTGNGWALYSNSGNIVMIIDDNSSAPTAQIASVAGAWCFAIGYYSVADTDVGLYLNCLPTVTKTNAVMGDCSGAGGWGLNCDPVGARDYAADISFVEVFTGVGIAGLLTAATVRAIQHRGCGLVGSGAMDTASAVFSRDTYAAWPDTDGEWHFAGPHLPCCGDTGGIRLSDQRENKCYMTVSPADAASVTVTGLSVASAVSDAAALATAKASVWGPNVYQVANATGGADYVSCGAATGGTGAHSLQALVRITAGSGARIGLWDGTNWTDGAAVHDGYDVRTMAPGITPANALQTWALKIPDGCTVRFIAMQCEERGECTLPLPNTAAAATYTSDEDEYDTGVDATDGGGSLELALAPLSWSSSVAAAGSVVVCGSTDFGTIRPSTNRLRAYDGTTTVDADDPTWADGTVVAARYSWGPKLYVRADDADNSVAYDGALPAGNLKLGRNGGSYSYAVQSLRLLSRYQEGPCQ